MDAIDQFLRLTNAYCAATGLAEATASTRCFGDGKRLTEIRRGGEVGARRLARAMRWFSDHWPDGVPWPADIHRPAPPAPANDTTPSPTEQAA